MSSSAMAKSACAVKTATLAGLLGRTVAMAASLTPQCGVSEFYDVSAGECRHCDEACFEHENGTIISFTETRCWELCPGYIKEPRVPQYPRQADEGVELTLMELGLVGFIIALFIICIIVVVILRSEIYRALKECCHSAKDMRAPSDAFGCSRTDISETSYVKLADPCDEEEIIDRVTCV